MSVKSQGYLFVLITMCIWGGFTILSRLNAVWHISAWDIAALRFGLAFVLLMPILLWRRDTAFLWSKAAIVLATTGGIGYCITVYSAFLYAPAAHAAIFLNGFIPLCTALAAYLIYKQPFDKHIWASLLIMLFSIAAMSVLMARHSTHAFGVGDLLFIVSAIWWGTFTALLRQYQLSAWHAMCSVAIWSALIYLPIYLFVLPKNLQQVEPIHLVVETVFHGVFVVIVATLTYVEAIKRLGAFKTGSIVTLAPFIAAIIAVPLLDEPLSLAMLCGLVGMGIGALQPWRWLRAAKL